MMIYYVCKYYCIDNMFYLQGTYSSACTSDMKINKVTNTFSVDYRIHGNTFMFL